MRRAVHRELLDPCGQRDRAADIGARALGRGDDFARRGIQHPVVESLEADTDILSVHLYRFLVPDSGARVARRDAECVRSCYSVMEATMPAPTVRPPSRMAKRRRSSIAIGTISSTSIVTLSPGITISVPSGSFTTPVTSVVRK